MDTQAYIKAYLRTIPLPAKPPAQLYIIGFVGVLGSGKSTVAKRLSERLGLYIASNDHIRRWLNEQGFEGSSPVQPLLQAIAEASTEYLFEHRVSHIIDNDLLKFYRSAQAKAAKYGAKLFLIHLTTPEEVILERLKRREANFGNATDDLSREGTEQYMVRKKVHAETPLPKNFLGEVDASLDLDPQLDIITKALTKELSPHE